MTCDKDNRKNCRKVPFGLPLTCKGTCHTVKSPPPNNYSPQCRWIAVDIIIYMCHINNPPLLTFISTSLNNCCIYQCILFWFTWSMQWDICDSQIGKDFCL